MKGRVNFFILAFLLFHPFYSVAQTVAVLPFNDHTGNPGNNWVGTSFSFLLSAKLAHVKGIYPVSTDEVLILLKRIGFTPSGEINKEKLTKEAKSIGVDTIIFGSYKKMGEFFLIEAQFTDVNSGKSGIGVSAGKPVYMFKMQNEIVIKFLEYAHGNIGEDVKERIKKNPTENLEAYEWFSRGCTAFFYTPSNVDAVGNFTKAIELDKNFAEAYKARADILMDVDYNGALMDYNMVIQFNPMYADAYFNRGMLHCKMKHFDEAIADFTKVIELQLGFAPAYLNRGRAYEWIGMKSEAMADYARAAELGYKNAEFSRGFSFSEGGGIEGGCAGTLLNLDPPPFVYDVNIQPENPRADEEVTVNAAIANDAEKTDAATVAAYLHYSLDGGKTFTTALMWATKRKDKKGHTEWDGKIPAQKAGTNVLYYVSASDDIGNYASETAGASTDGALPYDPQNGTGPLFSDPVPDELCKDAQPGIDIVGLRLGYDEKRIYGAVQMRGAITEGTLSPARINSVLVGFLNPDKGEDITKGTALIWAPLSINRNPEEEFRDANCIVIDQRIVHHTKDKMSVPKEESGAECIVSGDTLYFKVKRSIWGENPSSIVRIMAMTGILRTASIWDAIHKDAWLPEDATPHVYVYMRTHSYTVGREAPHEN